MSDNAKPNSIYQDRTGMEFYNPEREEIYKRFDEFVDIVFVQGKQIDWKASCEKKRLVPEENAKFEDLLGKDGAKVYAPLLEKEKAKKGKAKKEDDTVEKTTEKVKWMSEYPSNQDENGDWAQEKGYDKNKWAQAVAKDGNLRKLLDHLTYIWSLAPVMRARLYENGDNGKNTAASLSIEKKIFPEIGLWARGQGSSQKPDDFYALVSLMEAINKERQENKKINSVETVKNHIINYFTKEDEYKDKNPPIKNAFLHLCDAGKYAPIAVKSTKDEIKRNLKFVLSEKEQENLKDKTTDEWVLLIHQKLKEMNVSSKKGCIFFEPNVGIFVNNKDDGISDYSILKFKKSVILYGPPGTSKTYSAMELAKAILFEYYSKECKKEKNSSAQEELKKLFQNDGDEYNCDLIHSLQLHSNYSYEDFVWGYEIKEGCSGSTVSVARKGTFLKILDEMKEEKYAKPHILILDEINRVDLSRLLGELFSAIENRGKDIQLSVSFDDSKKMYKINIPEKLYIIGTMNEIDFSLERIDFALRRRFAWIFKGYDEDVLKKMVLAKDRQNQDYEGYFASCSALNKAINKDAELGEQYEIGHAIFADITTIREDVDNLKLAKKVLWNISIKPLLEAYLGNLEEDGLKKKLNSFAVEFGIKKAKNNEDADTESDEKN